MNSSAIIFIVLAVAWVLRTLRKDLRSGLCLIFGFLVFLPTSMRFSLPGALPEVTVHRILIVIAFLFVIKNRKPNRIKWPVRNLTLILLFGLEQFVSGMLGNHFITSIKGCINYGIETILFYLLISEYVQGEDDVVPLLRGISFGLAGVAIIAVVEKYMHFNPLDKVNLGMVAFKGNGADITSTYPHRILFGYAMAMGIPMVLALSIYVQDVSSKRIYYLIALLLMAADYFSTSRGPWLGLILALLGMAVLGGPLLRRRLFYIGILTSTVMLVRPGVWHTIDDLYQQTFSTNSEKGSTYSYRWELWGVAWKELNKANLILGYGPLTTEFMDLSENWSGEGSQASIAQIGHTSWDNNYACDLIELGVLGLTMECVLFLAIAIVLLRIWWNCEGRDRTLMAGVTVSCLIFMYSMTNVFIFAPQLKYLFWSLVAVGSNLPHVISNRHSHGVAAPMTTHGEGIIASDVLTEARI
ncbi:MAG TPA: O-antigen ligase family protein [Candidatus Saccharimonadales bacterium]|nr:O-antigen ligase family protein [Candidatus Saccharimonadales bacterium]